MTYQVQRTTYPGYTLCDKLKAQYGERTAATINRGVEANERRRSASTRQTRPNASNASREQGRRPSQANAENRRPAPRNASVYTPARPAGADRTRTVNETRRNVRPQNNTANARPQNAANRRPNVMRDTVVHKMAKPASDKTPLERSRESFPYAYRYGENIRRRAHENKTKTNAGVAGSAVAEKNAFLTRLEKISRFFLGSRTAPELKVKKAPFPLATVALLIVCTVMLMVMMNSFAQLNEYRRSVSDLEARQSQLTDKEKQLTGLIEARENIREIEKTATEELGMVSSDLVGSRFVSLATSDRVEVIAAPEENSSGALAPLLSVIGENLGRLSEYFN